MSERPRIPAERLAEERDAVARLLDLQIEGSPAPLGEHNIFRTLSRHPDLFLAWMRLGGYLLAGGTLPAADRELLVLRTAVRCGSSYEWGQHVHIALRVGVPREAIDRVALGPDAPGWEPFEAALLRAADELHETSTLSDGAWAALAERYDERQLVEAVMLVGQYHLVAFTLNAVGVELDAGLEPLPGADA